MNSKNKEISVCSSCQMSRSHKLPFIKSSNSSLDLLDKVHCDLWGPAPVTSVKGFRYYALFVDDSTHFCWFLPLQNKSDFYDCFAIFDKYLMRQFGKSMKVFHSDNGEEFVNGKMQ